MTASEDWGDALRKNTSRGLWGSILLSSHRHLSPLLLSFGREGSVPVGMGLSCGRNLTVNRLATDAEILGDLFHVRVQAGCSRSFTFRIKGHQHRTNLSSTVS